MSRLIIVLLCAGLMGPAMAADGGGPASAPQAAKAPNPDKVIADILSVSGMKATFEKMPKSFADSFRKGMLEAQKKKGVAVPPELQQALEASVKEAFTAKGFTERVSRAMKQDYNEKNYQELLADLSTPVATRMGELEAKGDPSDQELAAFLQQVASNPLPAERIDLIHRLDVASRASDIVSTVVLSINKGVLRGIAGTSSACVSEGQIARAEAAMVQQMEATRDSYSGAMQSVLSYTYREVSDADLAEYVKIYEKDNSKHIQDVIYAAMVEEYGDASARMGRSIMKTVRANPAAGSRACDPAQAPNGGAVRVADAANADSSASAVAPAAAPSGVAPAAQPSGGAASGVDGPKSAVPMEKRKGGDITQCLEAGSKSDKDIAACAEKYRP